MLLPLLHIFALYAHSIRRPMQTHKKSERYEKRCKMCISCTTYLPKATFLMHFSGAHRPLWLTTFAHFLLLFFLFLILCWFMLDVRVCSQFLYCRSLWVCSAPVVSFLSILSFSRYSCCVILPCSFPFYFI